MKKAIPNFNSFSTLVDRIVIEGVKRAIFELKQEEEKVSYQKQLEAQEEVLLALQTEFEEFVENAFANEEYDVIGETRTFS